MSYRYKMRLFVASKGEDKGEWVTLTGVESRFHEKCERLSPDGNVAIVDSANVPRYMYTENHVDSAAFDAADYLDTISDEMTQEAFLTWLTLVEIDDVRDDIGGHFEDSYQGRYALERIFAMDWLKEMGIPEQKIGNIKLGYDYDRLARDLFITDYVYENGFVFRM